MTLALNTSIEEHFNKFLNPCITQILLVWPSLESLILFTYLDFFVKKKYIGTKMEHGTYIVSPGRDQELR